MSEDDDLGAVSEAFSLAAADFERHLGVPVTEVDLPGWVWERYGADRIRAWAKSNGVKVNGGPDEVE